MTRGLFGLFTKAPGSSETEVIGEDMTPSPGTLAERLAAAGEGPEPFEKDGSRPFSTIAKAPIHDFRG